MNSSLSPPRLLGRTAVGATTRDSLTTSPIYLPSSSPPLIQVELYVKRDDLLPLAGGGSKTRKLDYLVHEAVKEGADVLVTSGAVQSNHCRLTASAAAREGMECHIVLEERVEGSYNPSAGGNNCTSAPPLLAQPNAGSSALPPIPSLSATFATDAPRACIHRRVQAARRAPAQGRGRQRRPSAG